MRIIWQFDDEDIENVNAFFDQHKDNHFVRNRIARNLSEIKPPLSKDDVWYRMLCCLLSTQQRSGPHSTVSRFLQTKPCPLGYSISSDRDDLAEFARAILSGFGGFRRSTVIGKELAANMLFLRNGGWDDMLHLLEEVRNDSSPDTEKRAAAYVDAKLKGFGPKQSRNLLQSLGLSRFEIPIDSRITKWLNNVGFPVKLTSNALQDRNYYNFVSDGFQMLCKACGIMPCVLDAAIFSSFDEDNWDEESLVW